MDNRDKSLIHNGKTMLQLFGRLQVAKKRLPHNPRDLRLNKMSEMRLFMHIHVELPAAMKKAERGVCTDLAYLLGLASGLSIPGTSS